MPVQSNMLLRLETKLHGLDYGASLADAEDEVRGSAQQLLLLQAPAEAAAAAQQHTLPPPASGAAAGPGSCCSGPA
jgi:hypothetical protein